MPRPKLPPEKRRRDITITPDPGVVAWVDARVGVGHRFHNRTHAFEYGIAKLMEEEANHRGGGPIPPPVDPGLAGAAHALLQRGQEEKPGSEASENRREKRKH